MKFIIERESSQKRSQNIKFKDVFMKLASKQKLNIDSKGFTVHHKNEKSTQYDRIQDLVFIPHVSHNGKPNVFANTMRREDVEFADTIHRLISVFTKFNLSSIDDVFESTLYEVDNENNIVEKTVKQYIDEVLNK